MHRTLAASLGIVCALLLAAGAAYAQDEPELPPGLGEPDEPALPPGLGDETADEEQSEEPDSWMDRLPPGLHGFWEVRAGPRIRNDPAQSETFTLAETRLRVEYDRPWRRLHFEFKGDVAPDAVTDEIEHDLRQLRLTGRFGDAFDFRVGRQVLTWGTGDLIFINDLFPKDWQSFFIGRDTEYLKAPSDSIRLGWFNRAMNVEVAYTPRFESDRYIEGERISFWSPALGGHAGEDERIAADEPDEWFGDDEVALRLYRRFGSYEFAIYGYSGFWKSPAGQDPDTMRALFPRLAVYGSSLRGPAGPGIANVEVGYYDSRDDRDGDDPFVDNGEFRLLVGYEQELARELTGSVQYYLEHMLDHGRYRQNLPVGEPRDENRHVLTFRLTKLLKNQNLTLSLFTYLSPSDRDGYARPRATYRLTDHWMVEAGANWFFGSDDHTFFGQFENNSNVYAAVRFSI